MSEDKTLSMIISHIINITKTWWTAIAPNHLPLYNACWHLLERKNVMWEYAVSHKAWNRYDRHSLTFLHLLTDGWKLVTTHKNRKMLLWVIHTNWVHWTGSHCQKGLVFIDWMNNGHRFSTWLHAIYTALQAVQWTRNKSSIDWFAWIVSNITNKWRWFACDVCGALKTALFSLQTGGPQCTVEQARSMPRQEANSSKYFRMPNVAASRHHEKKVIAAPGGCCSLYLQVNR